VVLNVLPRGSNPGAEVRPTGLIFIGQPGNSPGSQEVLVSNPTGNALTFGSGKTTVPSGGNWFLSLPTDATVDPNVPKRIVVQPDYSTLTAGSVSRGFLNLGFLDGTSRNVSILAVAAPSGAAGSDVRQATGCGSRLSVLPTSFTDQTTNLPVSKPVPLSVRVVDDCGDPVVSPGGSVIAKFSNGDPAIDMVHVGAGNWTRTWTPRNASQPKVTIEFTALAVRGATRVTGEQVYFSVNLLPDTTSPVTRGAANSASGAGTFVAPGGLVSIYGEQLADNAGNTTVVPFPTALNGTEVLLGGKPLRLRFVSSGQINAQVPFELAINTEQQLLVRRGDTLSVPQDVVVAATQPAIYTQDSSGKGPAVIVNGITNAVITRQNPARIGDVIVIYCNGLGAVEPPVPSGTPAPPNGPLSRTIGSPQLTIGGVNARVDFAGLAPGYPDLYQLNTVVPSSVGAGDEVPIILSIEGQSSPPVTIAIRE
jgi:uncharacterized protein (TIGR03437 family)